MNVPSSDGNLPMPPQPGSSPGNRSRTASSFRRGTFFGTYDGTDGLDMSGLNLNSSIVSSLSAGSGGGGTSPKQKNATGKAGKAVKGSRGKSGVRKSGGSVGNSGADSPKRVAGSKKVKAKTKTKTKETQPVGAGSPSSRGGADKTKLKRKKKKPAASSSDLAPSSASQPSSPMRPLEESLNETFLADASLNNASFDDTVSSTEDFSMAFSLRSSVQITETTTTLQNKLMKLSLEIEDAEKTAAILEEKLAESSRFGEVKQKGIAEKYRLEFQRQSKYLKMEMDSKMDECNKLTENKRELASQIKSLQGKIKMAEDRVADAVEKIERQGQANLDEAAASWGEGEVIRRKKWLERKTKEIREITIKGLEPEVERIIDEHKKECGRLEKEVEKWRRDFIVEWDTMLEEGREKVRVEGEKKRDEKLRLTRDASNNRLQDIHESHAGNLLKMRKKLEGETEAQRRWQAEELKRMATSHGGEMQSLREREGGRLMGMRRRWAEEKDGVERQLKAQLSAMDREEEEQREAWEARARGKAGKELEARVEAEREKARRDRDAEIEIAIRRIQAATAKAGNDHKDHLENQKGRMRAESEGVVRTVKGKKERWGKRMGENVDLIRDMEESKLSAEGTLRSLGEYMEKMDDEIERAIREREEQMARVVVEEERVKEVGGGAKKRLEGEKAGLRRLILEKRSAVERMEMQHKGKMDMLASEHDKDLIAIERRVKIDVNLKEGRTQELRQAVEEAKERCRGTEEIIKRYKRKERGREGGGGRKTMII